MLTSRAAWDSWWVQVDPDWGVRNVLHSGGYNRYASTDVAPVSHEDSTSRGLDMIAAEWTNFCNHSIDVPALSCVILNGHIRTNGDLG